MTLRYCNKRSCNIFVPPGKAIGLFPTKTILPLNMRNLLWSGRESLEPLKKVGKYESERKTPLGRLQNDLFKTEVATSPTSAYSADDGTLNFLDSDVKILLCPGEPREIREVVRAVTEEAQRRQTHFSQCGLVLRQFEAYRRMIGPQFENQEVPLAKYPSVFLMEKPPKPRPFFSCSNASNRNFPGKP